MKELLEHYHRLGTELKDPLLYTPRANAIGDAILDLVERLAGMKQTADANFSAWQSARATIEQIQRAQQKPPPVKSIGEIVARNAVRAELSREAVRNVKSDPLRAYHYDLGRFRKHESEVIWMAIARWEQ